ncbi:phage tail protein [Deminuibacter soli]|uniref:Phage tail protein n=1 Tax=Deminuibacter soli TaxID=2291815 RepID=A0A3E1NJV8_9BACT|nr:tail fiber protein [Deminuibacter soli]RFM28217.1 phage tail protein [Deminuibacter soli]
MDQPFLAAIVFFAGNFSPRGWAFCLGQIMSIAQNTALFSLLGTTYGGNGVSTFALPNFAGRVPVGTGTLPGGSTYTLGEVSGSENVTLNINQMPQHNHAAVVTPGAGSPTATATAFGINNQGGQLNPGGNFLGADNAAGAQSYALPGSGTPVAMATGAVTVTNITVPNPNVGIGIAGGSQPHSNMQPFLAMNYIIALAGIFPSRN